MKSSQKGSKAAVSPSSDEVGFAMLKPTNNELAKIQNELKEYIEYLFRTDITFLERNSLRNKVKEFFNKIQSLISSQEIKIRKEEQDSIMKDLKSQLGGNVVVDWVDLRMQNTMLKDRLKDLQKQNAEMKEDNEEQKQIISDYESVYLKDDEEIVARIKELKQSLSQAEKEIERLKR